MIDLVYAEEYLNEISFPLGGIGSGSIGLGGDGRLIDWEIFNRANKGSRNGCSHIAVKAISGNKVITKILNGDITKEFAGRYRNRDNFGFGFGVEENSLCGFPHFKNLTFKGEFPIAELDFIDQDFPANVKLTAFNPFIPLNDRDSSIPAAFFTVEIENNSNIETEYQVAFSVENPFGLTKNISYHQDNISYIQLLNAEVNEEDKDYGDLTVATDCENVIAQTYWYRGGWKDCIVTYWNEFNSKTDMPLRNYDEVGKHDTCTLVAKIILKPTEKRNVKFVLSWNVPNNYNYWSPYKDENGKDITWKNYYATIFENSKASAKYALENWNRLYEKTYCFKEALFGSTLDKTVIDAISSNLSVLKSPTVLRLSDGSFYGWEGLNQNSGSCEGTCQHVWNYAYALCFLFPKLERSIRDAEFKYSLDETGKTEFRLKLPYGRETESFRACVDGQMGTVFKMYREWKISGDDEWLKRHWEDIKKILEYAWSEDNPDKWDINKDGVMEGRQHHTLDKEFFGPSSWLEGMYLLALKVSAEMAEYLEDYEKSKEYKSLFEMGYEWTKNNLFNGEYFIQKIDLKDKSVIECFDDTQSYWHPEKEEIKYQIQNGSMIDQMLAQWHSNILGTGNVFDNKQAETALKSMMKNNFKNRMRDFVNPWRIFSLNDESGTVMCDYPQGVSKPAIPVWYCEETMTGFEYAFAGLLISFGMIDDGIKVVKAVRDRYDGKKRNPWNEIEAGSNYARSMSSFALLPIFSGFEFDLPNKFIGFNPRVQKDNFSCLWSLETGWGIFTSNGEKIVLEIYDGFLNLSSFGINYVSSVESVKVDGNLIDFKMENGILIFEEKSITNKLEILL